MIDRYDWAGGSEASIRFGPANGPVVIAALPLFEEANRTRTFITSILRALAERGIASALPDLPGQGESLVSTEQVELPHLKAAYSAAVEAVCGENRRAYSVSVRSGALIDIEAPLFGRWHFTPQTGPSLIRDLGRIGGVGSDPDWWCREEIYEVAGNRISSTLLTELMTAKPVENVLGTPLRRTRYQTDHADADLKVAGAPLWRRSEPGNDAVLVELLAGDIADWIATCEG